MDPSGNHLEDIDEETRMLDLEEALEFGNHKGASEQPELLTELTVKDVDYGFALPLKRSTIKLIPGVCMAPVNISPQYTINEFGEIVPKDKLTHNQSYEWGSGTSVNNRVKEETLLTCPFGSPTQVSKLSNLLLQSRLQISLS